MKKLIKVVAASLPMVAGAEITNGWMQTETNGTSDKAMASVSFSDPANWANGEINGVFGQDLPALFQVLTMAEDYTGTFNFSYAGNYSALLFKSSANTPRLVHLTDDFVFQPTATSGKVTFGYSDYRQSVDFDLGGETRKFIVKSNLLNFYSAITNGNVILDGDGGVVNVVGQGFIEGAVDIRPNMTLSAGYQTSGKRRLGDVSLTRSTLSFDKPNASYTDTIGNLDVHGDAGSVSVLKIAPNGKTMTVQAESLALGNGAVVAVQADGLGANSIVKFSTAPDACAGVVPGLVAGATSAANVNGRVNNKETYTAINLVSYDADAGLRPLTEADYSAEISATESVNLRVAPATTVEVTGSPVVNSLVLNATTYRDGSPILAGDGRLTVESGMVFAFGVKEGAKINAELDFANRTGYVVAGGPDGVSVVVTKPFYGSKGVVLSKLFPTTFDLNTKMSSALGGINITTTADEGTYVGDTYIQGPVQLNNSPFLPHGARSGDVYVNAWLGFGSIAINGLYGQGTVEGTTLTVGADSTFKGTSKVANLNVAGGTFRLEGTVASGTVNVASGASFGGSGTVATSVVFAEGSSLAVDVNDNGQTSCLTANSVSGAIKVCVGTGKWRTPCCVLKSASSLEGVALTRGTGVGHLELRNDGTELWVIPKKHGLTVILR